MLIKQLKIEEFKKREAGERRNIRTHIDDDYGDKERARKNNGNVTIKNYVKQGTTSGGRNQRQKSIMLPLVDGTDI